MTLARASRFWSLLIISINADSPSVSITRTGAAAARRRPRAAATINTRSETFNLPAGEKRALNEWCTLPIRPASSMAAIRTVYSPGSSNSDVSSKRGDGPRGLAGSSFDGPARLTTARSFLSSTITPVGHSTSSVASSPTSAAITTRIFADAASVAV